MVLDRNTVLIRDVCLVYNIANQTASERREEARYVKDVVSGVDWRIYRSRDDCTCGVTLYLKRFLFMRKLRDMNRSCVDCVGQSSFAG